MDLPVYLDYNATTPVDPRVIERMLPFFGEHFGNASSRAHVYGWAAEEAVSIAREEVAALLGAEPTEIVFTSGATEAANLAIKGAARAHAARGRHIVTAATEHAAVLDACRALQHEEFEITVLPVDEEGRVHPTQVEEALRDDTVLVALMWANNETGVLQPVEEIGALVRERGIVMFTDATQACGKVPVSAGSVDLMALSGHKMYGPKGVGALYVRSRPRVRLVALLDGGGQEGGLRAGTLNVPGIVGLGAAARIAVEEFDAEGSKLETQRNEFERRITEALPARILSSGAKRLPQTSSIFLQSCRAADLMQAMRELAVSAGSACASGKGRPSHVLKAMGLSDAEALATLRISLGRFTTNNEVVTASDALIRTASAALSVRRTH
jgi:cysteine desulfurase